VTKSILNNGYLLIAVRFVLLCTFELPLNFTCGRPKERGQTLYLSKTKSQSLNPCCNFGQGKIFLVEVWEWNAASYVHKLRMLVAWEIA